jgi:hypothetical protein
LNMKIPVYIKISEIITPIALCMFLFKTLRLTMSRIYRRSGGAA